MIEQKAKATFPYDLLDCEVQMLSKLSTTVKNYIKRQQGIS
jgi:hypothetical protein